MRPYPAGSFSACNTGPTGLMYDSPKYNGFRDKPLGMAGTNAQANVRLGVFSLVCAGHDGETVLGSLAACAETGGCDKLPILFAARGHQSCLPDS